MKKFVRWFFWNYEGYGFGPSIVNVAFKQALFITIGRILRMVIVAFIILFMAIIYYSSNWLK